ncbi:MAG TPA: isoaspartyl peptidase/L-asparaginase [Terriglobales bacterium]|nr:isoaspartyl peptidase/L-asparaginase [Terriglobales bacterium]
MRVDPVLVVHGGAWAMPDDVVEDHRRGVQKALRVGWDVLSSGGSALKAVEEAVVVMEDDDTFDAALGSFLTADGKVQMDALIMDGATLRAGGVGCVERLRNPIRAARLILSESPHVYFVGEGAEQFVAGLGMELIENSELVIEREKIRLAAAKASAAQGKRDLTFAGGHDTVGAVALDSAGHLAAATSTGGTINKTPGRVGDSSLIGCGCYADDQSGAVSCTGWGEPIMKLVLGKWAADRVASGAPPELAAREAIGYLSSRVNGHGGMILLDARGRYGIAHNTPRMAWAVKTTSAEEVGIAI